MSEQTQNVQEEFDPFQAAFAEEEKRKKEAEEAKNNAGNFDFENVKWQGLPLGQWSAFRIIGVPFDFRQTPFDPKLILRSDILKDDKKGYVKINWPYVIKNGKFKPDPEWILSKLYNNVMESDWVHYTEKDIDPSKKIRKNEKGEIVNAKNYNGYFVEKHTKTESYQIIKSNNKGAGDKTKNKFQPAFKVVMNVIDRMDEWCIINKHTKCLANADGISEVEDKKTGEKKIVTYAQSGISKTMYDEIIAYIREGCGNWKADLAIKRYKDSQDMYKNMIVDAKLPKDRLHESIRELMSDKPLTDEEKAYEMYDLDKLFKISSYQKILKNLGGLFKLYDKEFNDNLYDELVMLAEQEKKEMEARKETEKEDKDETEVEIETQASTEVKEEPKKERKARDEKPIDIPKPETKIIDFANATVFKNYWSNLDQEDKDEIMKYCIGFDEDGHPLWKPNTTLIKCDNCPLDLPKTVLHCPNCDAVYS